MLDVQAALQRAHAAYVARRFDEARAGLDALIRTGGPRPQALHLLALVHKGRGDAAASKAAFAAALRLVPRDAEIHNNLGNLLGDLGEDEGALDAYGRALTARPGFADALLNRAATLQRLGRHTKALADAEAALARAPGSARAHSLRGGALLALDRLEEAARAYDLALDADPARAVALAGRARVAMQRGEDAAVPLLRRAAAARPGDPAIALQLAEAMEAAGDPDALPTLARAVAARPDWAEGQSVLARMRWEAGEGRAFTRDLEAAVAADPRRAPLWHALAGALAAADLHSEAADAARDGRRSLADDPVLAMLEAVQASEAGDLARADRSFAGIAVPVPGREVLEARHRLRHRDVQGADALLSAALDGDPWDVSAWALQGVVWRLNGDDRAEWLHRQPGLVAAHALDLAPEALASVAARLRSLHKTRAHPIGQSLRGGTQTRGRLFDRLEPEVRQLRDAIAAALDRHWDALPPRDDVHPLLRHRNARPRFDGSWSVRLTGGGFHVAHIHPHGVLSSACYLSVPPPGEDGEGWIEIGRPPPELGLDLDPTASFAPEPGRLVLFPSTLFHGTRPFGAGERLTAAFDVVPTGESG